MRILLVNNSKFYAKYKNCSRIEDRSLKIIDFLLYEKKSICIYTIKTLIAARKIKLLTLLSFICCKCFSFLHSF